MAGNRTLKLSILADVDDLRKKLGDGSKDVGDFGDKITKFGKVAAAAFAAAAVAAGAFAIKFGKDAVLAASDLNETISKTGVLFGKNAKEVEDFASKAATALGQSKQQALDAAATFATFGKSAGLAGKDLVKFSTDFVTLAGDLASFNNTTPEQAINAIGAALRGESEPLRAFGVLLDDASLRAAAFEAGIISTTKNALTPQQKVLAAQILIYEQTGAAQGDFGRTSEGLANSQRILGAQIENITVQLGTALLPVITEVFGFIGSKLIPAVQGLADEFGPKLTPIFSGIVNVIKNDLLPILQKWWGFLSNTVIPAISAVLTPAFEGLKSAFNTIKKAVDDNREGFEKFQPVIKAVAEFIRDKVAPILGGAFKLALQAIGTVIGGLVSGFGKLAGFIGDAYEQLRNFINLIKNNPVVKGISSVVSGLFGGGKAAGGPVKAGTSYVVGERGAEMFVPKTDGVIIPNNKMGGGNVTNLNINVTGALDKEGVARQIVDILNNSFYRGTLAAGSILS
jgi:phage-related protein